MEQHSDLYRSHSILYRTKKGNNIKQLKQTLLGRNTFRSCIDIQKEKCHKVLQNFCCLNFSLSVYLAQIEQLWVNTYIGIKKTKLTK